MADTDIDTASVISAEAVPGLLTALVGLVAPQRPERVEREHALVTDLGFHSIALAELGFTVEDLFYFETQGTEAALSPERVGDIIDLVSAQVADGTATLPETAAVEAVLARYGAAWPLTD